MTSIHAPVSSTYRLLEGVWVNQLGSEVAFTPDLDGHLRGDYCGRAGTLAGRRYPIIGSYQQDPVRPTVPLAFMVSWSEAHCVTTWCGHFIPAQDRIETTWLMATETESRDEWKSTVIGHDLFHRME